MARFFILLFFNVVFYLGENVLHMAVADNNVEMLRFFLQTLEHMASMSDKMARYVKYLCNQRACGSFFMAKDQSKMYFNIDGEECYGLPEATTYHG